MSSKMLPQRAQRTQRRKGYQGIRLSGEQEVGHEGAKARRTSHRDQHREKDQTRINTDLHGSGVIVDRSWFVVHRIELVG